MKTHFLLNKCIVICFLFVGIIGTFKLNAQTFTVGDLNYQVNVDGISVTVKGHKNGQDATGELIIPESVTYNENSYAVTIIGESAFYGCTGLTGHLAIPNSVTIIGDYAFEGCEGLADIEIPNSVASIGSMCFMRCSGLLSITIPNSVTAIGYGAFCFCSGLTAISVDTDNPVYDSRNNCNAIIKTLDNELYYGCKTTIIPNTVSSIGDHAYFGCSGLTHITIPNSVTAIGIMSFWACSGLIDIVIPNSVTSLGMMAFGLCDRLSSITIGASVTNITRDVFMECTGITEISVDSGNPVYDSRDNCNAIIKTVENELILGSANTIIPNSVTSIAYEAFSYCSGLTYITIPASVTNIGRNPFAYCSGLTAITVDSENPVYDSRDNCNAIIKTTDNELISGCKNTIIPNSVTSIGLYAFAGCFWIDKCIIPNTITNIGGGAFYKCSGSNVEITIGNSVEYIDDYAFACFLDVTKIEILVTTPPNIGSGSLHLFEEFSCSTLIVPCGCVSAYENSAWHNYFHNIIENCSDVLELDDNLTSIYPNPTSGIVIIATENIQNISIYNVLGEQLYNTEASGDVFEYDFSNNKTGAYFVRVETSQGVETKRVVVK